MDKVLLSGFLISVFFNIGYSTVLIQDDIQYQVDTLNNRSFDLRTTHQTLGMTYAREALSLSKKINYNEGLYSAYLNLGIHFELVGQYDSSIYYLRLSINYTTDSLKLGISKYYAGLIYSNLRDFDRAKEYLKQAQDILQKAKDSPFPCYATNSLGVIEARRGNYNKALDYFMEAYKIKKERGLTPDEELANIAHVYQIMGNLEKAKEFTFASLVISNNQKDTLGIIEGSISLGDIYKDMNQYDSANFYLSTAYAISSRMGYTDQAATTLIAKSDLLMKMSRTNEAIVLLKKVFELPLHPASAKRYIVNNKLAKYFFEKNEYDTALYYARRSYQFFIHSSMFKEAQDGAILLATIFEKNKKFDSSNYFLKRALQHGDSINVLANRATFSDQRVRIETLEKDHEISQLLNQQKVSELISQRIKIWSLVVVLIALIIILVIIYQHKVVLKNKKLINLKLRAEIEQNKSDLYKQTLHMIQINNSMEAIEGEIKEALSSNYDQKLAKLLSSVKTNRSLKSEWDNFNKYFGNVHTDFLKKLSAINAELSTHEKKVCSLIRLNLSNREMATLLNIESKSVIMIKYRIKKKLALAEDMDIENYLHRL